MFSDRRDAGHRLAIRLVDARSTGELPADPLVLGLPRGGVPLAAAVAEALDADLDVLVVRKLGAPANPELAMGAVGEDGVVVIDHAARRALHVSGEEVDRLAAEVRQEVDRRVGLYRRGAGVLSVAGRAVVIVDDGMATGSTAEAAVRVVRHLGASHVTLAVPVGSAQACERLEPIVDRLVCLKQPEPFYAVGQHYADFRQVDDDEVIGILDRYGRSPSSDAADVRDLSIPAGEVELSSWLAVPEGASGVVVFAHGSGSGRDSPRNQAVARQLRAGGLATLLIDLVAPTGHSPGTVVELPQLACRLTGVLDWMSTEASLAGLPVGAFGSSTGAAVALVAAAERPDLVRAVVSRGGRVDLAGAWLPRVAAPTLLIVGGHDLPVLDLNRQAQQQMTCTTLLEVVPGADHLFEQPGTLAQVGRLAQTWFVAHLP